VAYKVTMWFHMVKSVQNTWGSLDEVCYRKATIKVKNVTDKQILLGLFKSPWMILRSKDTALYSRILESSATSS